MAKFNRFTKNVTCISFQIFAFAALAQAQGADGTRGFMLSEWDGTDIPPAAAPDTAEARCNASTGSMALQNGRFSDQEFLPVYTIDGTTLISIVKKGDGSYSAGISVTGKAYEVRKVQLTKRDRKSVRFEGQGFKLTVYVHTPVFEYGNPYHASAKLDGQSVKGMICDLASRYSR